MRNILKSVEGALLYSEAARNSDDELYIFILQNEGAGLTTRQQELIKSIPYKTVERYRRTVQNKRGMFKATDRVQLARRTKALVAQQNMPSDYVDVDKVLKPIRVVLPWGKDE